MSFCVCLHEFRFIQFSYGFMQRELIRCQYIESNSKSMIWEHIGKTEHERTEMR
jgi:hypothetical protein